MLPVYRTMKHGVVNGASVRAFVSNQLGYLGYKMEEKPKLRKQHNPNVGQ